jgi:hypothetical protein
MKTFAKIAVAALFIGGVTLTSCKKYEEGPSLTLLSKKARIAGSWGVEKLLVDGVDKTSDYRAFVTSETITMEKDGTYSSTYTFAVGSDTDAGTWELINDKADFKTLSNDAGSTPDTMVIVRLTNKEFWMKEKTPGSSLEEVHYMAK